MTALVAALEQLTGIVFPEYRRPVLQAELERLAGTDKAWNAVDRLRQGDPQATTRLLRISSIPETYLFRYKGHFELLRRIALDLREQGRSCRVLCAGCSTGEEVWSAAAVLAAIPAPAGESHQVVGWELCEERLQHAAEGRYGPWSCREGIFNCVKYFHSDGTGVRVAAELHDLVRFQQVNLVADELPPLGQQCDVLFFRNVAIYWRQETVDRVWQRLITLVNDGGTIFIGPSDPVPIPAGDWQQHIEMNVRYYRKDSISGRKIENEGAPPAAPRTGRSAGLPPSWPTPPCDCRLTTKGASRGRSPGPDKRSDPPPAAPTQENHSQVLDAVRQLADNAQYQAALDLLDSEQAGVRGTADGKLWYGILAFNLGNKREALRMLRQCTYLRPDEPEPRFWLAVAYDALGLGEAADREYRNALQMREGKP